MIKVTSHYRTGRYVRGLEQTEKSVPVTASAPEVEKAAAEKRPNQQAPAKEVDSMESNQAMKKPKFSEEEIWRWTFKIDPELQREFGGSLEAFLAFKKAEKEGRVRIAGGGAIR